MLPLSLGIPQRQAVAKAIQGRYSPIISVQTRSADMSIQDVPKIYLITPNVLDLNCFPRKLSEILDAIDVSCLRLSLSSSNEDEIARAADAVREITHTRDVAVVIEQHTLLVARLGLDGVHLTNGTHNIRQLRKNLGKDVILGAFCNASRHAGLNAGEAGADYVSFGPVSASALGDGKQVDPELLAWWSEMIEIPVVAEGGITEEKIQSLSDKVDFFGIGSEIWEAEDPVLKIKTFSKAIKG